MATSAVANAQGVSPLSWKTIDVECPGFIRASASATFFVEGEKERVEIGGVIFEHGASENEEGSWNLDVGVPDSEQAPIRVVREGCAATGIAGSRKTMSPEEARAFSQRVTSLRTARAEFQAADKAAAARELMNALSATRRACIARSEALGASHQLVATCETQVARRALAASRHAEALEAARSALELLSRQPAGTGQLETYAALQFEAGALYYLGKPLEMYEAARRSYEGRVRILGPMHPDTVSNHTTLAVSLQSLGKLDEAIVAHEEVLRLQMERTGPSSAETIRAKLNLSSALKLRGDVDRVVALQTEVYQTRRVTLGVADPSTLAVTHDLGIALVDAGRIEEALPLVASSLTTFLGQLGEDHTQTLRIKTLLAVIYERLGREEEALPLYSEVYAARRRILGDAHASTVSAAFNLANILLVLDRPSDAMAIVDVALERMPTGASRVAATEHDLWQVKSEALLRRGDAKGALDVVENRLGTRAMRLEDVRTATTRQLTSATTWAQARFELGSMSEASDAMEVIYRGCRERFGPDQRITRAAMSLLAGMLTAAQRFDEAQRLLAEFVEINERLLRDGVAVNSATRGYLVQGVRDRPYTAGYRTYVRLLAAQDPARALEIAELTKARSLSETLARPQADNPRVKAARIRFARADERVAEVDVGSAPYLQAVADRTKAEEELRNAMGPSTRRSSIPDVRATLKRVLAPGTAFVDFIVSGDRVTAITSNNLAKVTARDLGTIPGLADMVEAFRRATTSPDPTSERMWIFADGSIRWSLSQPQGATRLTDLDAIGRKLSARLLDPLAADIGIAKTWIISPDGPLAFLPFEALRIGKQLVLETKNVVYTPSLSSLAIMPARVTTGPRWDFLGIGVSNFGKSSPWRDLPEAEAEVNAIGELFPVSRVLTGSQATEERFRALDTAGELRRYRYVHFATHAFLSDRGTSLSGVVLAGAGTTGGDGIITAAEWPTYRLDSDLVVLSACDTGLGRLVAGEGVVGLPSAFLTAGTRAVVLTLWSVADSSAAEFMPRFYKRLKGGRAPAEALRETKLELARSKGPWSSPRHWAPYVLYGAP